MACQVKVYKVYGFRDRGGGGGSSRGTKYHSTGKVKLKLMVAQGDKLPILCSEADVCQFQTLPSPGNSRPGPLGNFFGLIPRLP